MTSLMLLSTVVLVLILLLWHFCCCLIATDVAFLDVDDAGLVVVAVVDGVVVVAAVVDLKCEMRLEFWSVCQLLIAARSFIQISPEFQFYFCPKHLKSWIIVVVKLQPKCLPSPRRSDSEPDHFYSFIMLEIWLKRTKIDEKEAGMGHFENILNYQKVC